MVDDLSLFDDNNLLDDFLDNLDLRFSDHHNFLNISWNLDDSFNNFFVGNNSISVHNDLFNFVDDVMNWLFNNDDLSILDDSFNDSFDLNDLWNLDYSFDNLFDNSGHFNDSFAA